MTTEATGFAPWRGVFETLRVIEGRPLFVAAHLAELRRAMEALGLRAGFDPAREQLPKKSGRWRWIVATEGARTLFTEEKTPLAAPVTLSVSAVRVGSHNWDARFKTVSYLSHVQAAETAGAGKEAILLNEHGHVAGAARANIFWRKGGRLFTPAHEAGCRCGVVRGFVLGCSKVEIGQFPLEDLLAADEIFLTSSLKGIVFAKEIEGRAMSDFSAAGRLRGEYEKAVAAEVTH